MTGGCSSHDRVPGREVRRRRGGPVLIETEEEVEQREHLGLADILGMPVPGSCDQDWITDRDERVAGTIR